MFVIAGYIIANRPIGTPSEIRFGTLASKVPAAIALIDSMGGVRAKSETESRFPMAMPIAMLNEHEEGQEAEVLELREQSGGHRSGGRVDRSRPRARECVITR